MMAASRCALTEAHSAEHNIKYPVLVVLGIGLLVGCRPAPRQAAPVTAVDTVLPVLHEVIPIVAPEAYQGHGGMAIGPAGHVAFSLSGKENDPRLAILDSTGRLVAAFARTGDGPGEVRAIGSLWFEGDTLNAFDLMAQRVQRYTSGGRYLSTMGIGGIGQPSGMTSDGVAAVKLGDSGPAIVLIDADGRARPLVARGDVAYDSLVVIPFRDRPDRDRLPMPALAVWGDLVAFADAWTYRVAWARRGGTSARFGEGSSLRFPTPKDVAEMRRSLELWRGPDRKPMDPGSIDRQVTHFASTAVAAFDRRPGYGMAFDGSGRLWIPREVADSVAWDVLVPGRLLGTITLPCAGGPNRARSINGVHLAMECESELDSVPVIRVWRLDPLQ